MFGLISQPTVAFRSGALLCCLTAVILYWKAREAPMRDHRKTELWIMLDRNPGLPEAYAGRVINAVLTDVYRHHAAGAAVIALLLWLISVAIS